MTKKSKKEVKKAKVQPVLDPARQEDLKRLAALESLMSPFWSSRSGIRFSI